MLVYDKARGEIVESETGLVVADHIIDQGPEWRSYRPEKRRCHVMYRRNPEPLRFFKGLIPKYVYEDAGRIMRRLGLGGRAGALAAIMYSAKRYGVPLPSEAVYFINAEKRAVYRVYRRIVEELGVPERIEDATTAQLVGLAVKLGKPHLAPLAVKLYRRLREKNQGYRSSTLAAVALVLVLGRAGLPAREVTRYLGVAPSTLSKALKRVEA